MPFAMAGYVQSVVIHDTVYVGGGFTGAGRGNIVMAYNGKWILLPSYVARDFAMTKIGNQLVLVSGWYQDCRKLGVWSATSDKWVYPYPDMLTVRPYCSAVVYKEWLIVFGGITSSGRVTSNLEVMNIDSKQWYDTGYTAPWGWISMKTAVAGDMCYFMGGFTESDRLHRSSSNKMYSVSLPHLISKLPSGEALRESLLWGVVSGQFLKKSSPLAINGSLLAFGGCNRAHETVSAIHLYKPDTEEWVKVGELPTPRCNCSCIVSAEKQILVIGGNIEDSNVYLNTVDIAQIQ